MQIDVWLKRIWLLIGSLVLLFLLIVGIVMLIEFISSPSRTTGVMVGENALPHGIDSLIKQDLSFNKPRPVGRTNLLYIGVGVRELTSEVSASHMRISTYRLPEYYENLINVVFTKSNGSDSYLLLNRKAFIKMVDIPSELDSLQTYSLYDIAFEDTDSDGRINAMDSSQLYISDLRGMNLLRITNYGDVLQWYDKSKDFKQIFISVKEKQIDSKIKPEDWPERLYTYDIKQRNLTSFPTNNLTIDKARQLIWSK